VISDLHGFELWVLDVFHLWFLNSG
jgi:hypothetical protein